MNYLNDIINNIDKLTITITIAVAVIGWIFALFLQGRNIKHQQKATIRYDIYNQFVQLHKKIQGTLSTLNAKSSPPFILMSSSMIPFELKLKKEYKGNWLEYSEMECLLDGEKKWNSFVQELIQANIDFNNKYIDLLYLFGDWTAVLKPLLITKDIFSKEIEIIKAEISEDLSTLQMYTSKQDHDWRTWDQEQVNNIAQRVGKNGLKISMYIGDFMTLIHNNLLSKYFRQKRPIRKTLDAEYKVLTKEGIVEKVDWKKVRKMESYKKELIEIAQKQIEGSEIVSQEYKDFLNSIVNEICPSCKNPLLVISAENNEKNFNFKYACGHGWKGFTLEDSLTIRELIKMKGAREGFGMIRKTIQGWKPSGDPKLKNGVEFYMDVNVEKNEYHQVVKDDKTKKVLHEEHEPLTEHKK